MSSSKIRGAIFCVYDVGSMHNAFPLATTLAQRGVARVLVVAGEKINGWEAHSRAAQVCGVKTLHCPTNTYAGTKLLQMVAEAFVLPRPQHLAALDSDELRDIPHLTEEDYVDLLGHAEVKKEIRRRQNALRTALTIIDMLDANTLFLGQDNLHFDTAIWVRAMQSRGGAAVLQCLGDTLRNASLEHLVTCPEYVVHDSLGEMAARLFPHWLAELDGTRVLRLPPAAVTAVELLGLASPHPCVFNSSHSDVVCINGEHARASYLEHGFAPERLVVTGHASTDALHARVLQRESLRVELYNQLKLDPDRPLALCLLTNNKTTTVLSPAFGGNHLVMGHLLGQSLVQAGWNTVLCPHPAGEPALFPLLQDPRWRVVAKPGLELLPLADLCVGYGSTVEYMARALGLSCIVYDAMGKWLDLHKGGDGYFVVDTLDKLATIAALLAQPKRRAVIAASTRQQSAQWALVDGRATERILQTAEDILSPK